MHLGLAEDALRLLPCRWSQLDARSSSPTLNSSTTNRFRIFETSDDNETLGGIRRKTNEWTTDASRRVKPNDGIIRKQDQAQRQQ